MTHHLEAIMGLGGMSHKAMFYTKIYKAYYSLKKIIVMVHSYFL